MSNVHVQLQDELRNSVEIEQTAKKEFYVKSIKLYWGTTTNGKM